ncbi:hypothetical protein FACS189447_07500 [Spirochaetia bacterium]|nr:hypothetical protein FACS189447_07500 [Spirochaetia bacterium]
MVGLPKDLFTKEDWLNAVGYANSTGQGKSVMIARLNGLKQNIKINVLKQSSAGKDSEELTPEDFEPVDDPNCEIKRLGFSETEINGLIGGLE